MQKIAYCETANLRNSVALLEYRQLLHNLCLHVSHDLSCGQQVCACVRVCEYVHTNTPKNKTNKQNR